MKKSLFMVLALFVLLLGACAEQASKESIPEEPKYESSELAWYEMIGEWEHVSGGNYIELYDNNTFYDSRYDLTGSWDESQDEGDVIFYYDSVPELILSQGWDGSDTYYECYGYDYSENVMFDVDTGEAMWRKF